MPPKGKAKSKADAGKSVISGMSNMTSGTAALLASQMKLDGAPKAKAKSKAAAPAAVADPSGEAPTSARSSSSATSASAKPGAKAGAKKKSDSGKSVISSAQSFQAGSHVGALLGGQVNKQIKKQEPASSEVQNSAALAPPEPAQSSAAGSTEPAAPTSAEPAPADGERTPLLQQENQQNQSRPSDPATAKSDRSTEVVGTGAVLILLLLGAGAYILFQPIATTTHKKKLALSPHTKDHHQSQQYHQDHHHQSQHTTKGSTPPTPAHQQSHTHPQPQPTATVPHSHHPQPSSTATTTHSPTNTVTHWLFGHVIGTSVTPGKATSRSKGISLRTSTTTAPGRSTTSTTTIQSESVDAVAASFEISLETDDNIGEADVTAMMKDSIASTLGVSVDMIVSISVVDESSLPASFKPKTDATGNGKLLRQLSVQAKEIVVYEVIVPPDANKNEFVKKNQDMLKKGSSVQQTFKQNLASESTHVKVGDVVEQNSPHVEHIAVKGAQPARKALRSAGLWMQLVVAAIVLVGILGAASAYVIRTVSECPESTPSGSPDLSARHETRSVMMDNLRPSACVTVEGAREIQPTWTPSFPHARMRNVSTTTPIPLLQPPRQPITQEIQLVPFRPPAPLITTMHLPANSTRFEAPQRQTQQVGSSAMTATSRIEKEPPLSLVELGDGSPESPKLASVPTFWKPPPRPPPRNQR